MARFEHGIQPVFLLNQIELVYIIEPEGQCDVHIEFASASLEVYSMS